MFEWMDVLFNSWKYVILFEEPPPFEKANKKCELLWDHIYFTTTVQTQKELNCHRLAAVILK